MRGLLRQHYAGCGRCLFQMDSNLKREVCYNTHNHRSVPTLFMDDGLPDSVDIDNAACFISSECHCPPPTHTHTHIWYPASHPSSNCLAEKGCASRKSEEEEVARMFDGDTTSTILANVSCNTAQHHWHGIFRNADELQTSNSI